MKNKKFIALLTALIALIALIFTVAFLAGRNSTPVDHQVPLATATIVTEIPLPPIIRKLFHLIRRLLFPLRLQRTLPLSKLHQSQLLRRILLRFTVRLSRSRSSVYVCLCRLESITKHLIRRLVGSNHLHTPGKRAFVWFTVIGTATIFRYSRISTSATR